MSGSKKVGAQTGMRRVLGRLLRPKGKFSKRALQRFEAKVGAPLPDSLRALLEQANGAALPFGTVVKRRGVDLPIQLFLALEHGGSEISSVFELTREYLDPQLVPFARDPFGNFFCFVSGGAKAGQIVFAHLDDSDDGLYEIASTFDDFLELLDFSGCEDD